MIYDKASLVQIPSGYKSGTLYSVVPNTADGDFTVTGDPEGEATRVNKDGLIESVAADVPRLDYPLLDGVVQDCPTLLLEPSRTNKQTYSQELSNSAYLNVNLTVAADQTTAPDGTLTADKVQRNATSASYLRGDINESTNGYYYSSSFFIKKGNCDRVAFRLQTNYPDRYDVRFVFSTESVEYDATLGDMTNGSYNIVKYNNGWYRIELTAKTASDNTAILPILSPRVSTGNIDSSDTSSDAFCYSWGWQTETSGNTSSGYATSYIPTTAAVTRTADTCNIANYTNLPTDYPLTVYWKGQVKEFNGFNCAFSIYQDGASGGFLTVSFNTSSQILVRRAIGGSEDIDFISHSYSLGDVLKIGIKFTSATTFKLFIDGLEIYEETSGVSKTWDFNSVLIGQLRVAADTGNRNPCDALMLFNEALSDSELETITSYTSFNQMAKALLYTIE